MALDPVSTRTIPFHLAQAYGLAATRPVAPVRPITPSSSSAPIARVGPESAPAPQRAGALDHLVAAVVPGSIDFTQPEPAQRGALPFYARPGDANAAATAIRLGRALDVEA